MPVLKQKHNYTLQKSLTKWLSFKCRKSFFPASWPSCPLVDQFIHIHKVHAQIILFARNSHLMSKGQQDLFFEQRGRSTKSP